MKRIILAGLSLALSVLTASAADVSVFKNLGFSPDGRYFMFAQYGIDSTRQSPYADVFTVNVPKNTFVNSGVVKTIYPSGVTVGDDGQKALYAQLEKVAPLRKSLKLDFLSQGRPVYFRVVSENTPADYDNIKFTDYKTGWEYSASMKKTVSTNGSVVSSFYIDLEIHSKDGKLIRHSKIGHPDFQRKGVSNYTMAQILLSPNEKGLVIVVEKQEDDGTGGNNIRYMVETLTL